MTPSPARDELTDTAADAAIDQACRILRLPTIRDRHAEIAAAAARQQAGYKGFLTELLSLECDDREQRRKARLVRDAGFPRPKRLEDFDYSANPNVPAALIGTLARSAWVAAGQPACLIGDSGTGKSHLLIGLGTAAAENGCKVRYATAAALVNELVEAADDKTLSRTIARYGRIDLLCLDELGYLELGRRGAELLFQVFTEREERDAEVVVRLSTVRVSGKWTAEMFLMFQLRRLDVWPTGDLGVRKGFGLAWGIPTPTAKELEPLGDPYRPYRSVVAWYCWRAAELYKGAADSALTR